MSYDNIKKEVVSADFDNSIADLDNSTVDLVASSLDPNESTVDLDASGLLVSSAFTEEVIDLLVSENHEFSKYLNFTPNKPQPDQTYLEDKQMQSNKRKFESVSQDEENDYNKNNLSKIKKEAAETEPALVKKEPPANLEKPKPVERPRQENTKYWYDGTGYTCQVCAKTFYQLRFFRTHLRKTHKISGSQLGDFLSEAIRRYDEYLYRNRFTCQICFNTRICHDKDSIKTHLRMEHKVSLEEYKAEHVHQVKVEQLQPLETYNPELELANYNYNPEMELANYLVPGAQDIHKEMIGNNNSHVNQRPAPGHNIPQVKTLVYSEAKVRKKELNFGKPPVQKDAVPSKSLVSVKKEKLDEDTAANIAGMGKNYTAANIAGMGKNYTAANIAGMGKNYTAANLAGMGKNGATTQVGIPAVMSLSNWSRVPPTGHHILEELERKRPQHQVGNNWINNQ